MMESKKNADELNELLRGEISAVETYRIARDQLKASELAGGLSQIAGEHQAAVTKLTTAVRSAGGEPAASSGPWGAFAKTVAGAASTLGDKAVLKALKEGEEHGLKEYKDALEASEIDDADRSLLRSFVPQQRSHIASIDSMMRTLH